LASWCRVQEGCRIGFGARKRAGLVTTRTPDVGAPTGIQRKLKAAGFARSVAAIQIKLNRERIKSNLEGYSACQLAGAMGIDAKKVLRWIKDGVLKAERRGTDRLPQQGGDTWWISDQGVRRFVLRFPEEIDLARVEKIWFLNLVTNGKLYSGLRS
jgi:hypothetical protein